MCCASLPREDHQHREAHQAGKIIQNAASGTPITRPGVMLATKERPAGVMCCASLPREGLHPGMKGIRPGRSSRQHEGHHPGKIIQLARRSRPPGDVLRITSPGRSSAPGSPSGREDHPERRQRDADHAPRGDAGNEGTPRRGDVLRITSPGRTSPRHEGHQAGKIIPPA